MCIQPTISRGPTTIIYQITSLGDREKKTRSDDIYSSVVDSETGTLCPSMLCCILHDQVTNVFYFFIPSVLAPSEEAFIAAKMIFPSFLVDK